MRATTSPQQMAEVLTAALAAGINHIETAPAYGPAEAFLGQALRQWRGSEPLVITSKLLPGIALEEGKIQLREILQRLGLERLDNLAVHGLNRPEHLDWALRGAGAELLRWALAE